MSGKTVPGGSILIKPIDAARSTVFEPLKTTVEPS
jgi:hypothetical protein